MTQQQLRLPPLTKRGVALLSVASTALTMMAATKFFMPEPAPATPPAPQIIVIIVPAPAQLPPAPPVPPRRPIGVLL